MEPETSLDVREKIAHIDQMLADIDRTFADRDRKRQEIRFESWKMVVAIIAAVSTTLAAGAALFAAGVAFTKFIG